MEEGRSIWRKIGIALEVIFGLLAIWVVATIIAVAVTMLVMKISLGHCTTNDLSDYAKYVQIGYTAFVGISFAWFLNYMYNRYKSKNDGE